MSGLPPKFIDRLDSIIDDHLDNEDFSIEFLCKQLSISYTHTYRKIRNKTGLTPSMYVCQKRLNRACQLLEESELKMSEIAYQVGFNTQAYFSKCFSDHYHCSPLKYRKQSASSI